MMDAQQSALFDLAAAAYEQGNWQAAMHIFFALVRALQEQVETDSDNDPELITDFATVLMNLGLVLHKLTQLDSALVANKIAEKLLRVQIMDYPSREHLVLLATILANQGYLHYDLSHLDAALAVTREAEKLLRCQAEIAPNLKLLASVLMQLGVLHSESNQPDDALEVYREAEELLCELSDTTPSPEVLGDLASVLTNRGNLHTDLGQADAALVAYEKAESLLLAQPKVASNPRDFMILANNLGELYRRQLNQPDVALTAYRKAEELLKVQADASPDPERLTYLAVVLMNRGLLHFESNQPDEALAAYCEAEGLFRSLAKRQPSSVLLAHLARILMNRGVVHNASNQPDTALAAYREAEELLQLLIETAPSPKLLEDFAHLLTNKGIVHRKLNQPEDVWTAVDSVFELYGNLRRYQGDFIDCLQRLSDLLLFLSDGGTVRSFMRIQNLVVDYLEQLAFNVDYPKTELAALWQLWLHHALEHQDSGLLLAVVSASYARRLLSLLHLNLLQADGLDADTAAFVRLAKQRDELGLALAGLEGQRSQRGHELTAQDDHHYQQRLAAYEDLNRQWLASRDHLIKTGQYPDLHKTRFDVDGLQQRLSHGEAVLLSLSFSEFGLDEVPHLLLVTHDRLLEFKAPEQTAAAETVRLISRLLHGRGQHLPVRRNHDSQPEKPRHVLDQPTVDALLPPLASSLSLTIDLKWRVLCQLLLEELSVEQVNRFQEVFEVEIQKIQEMALEDQETQKEVNSLRQLQQHEWEEILWPAYQNPIFALKHIMENMWGGLQAHLADVRHLAIVGHGDLNGLPWQGYAPPSLQVSHYAGLYALQQRSGDLPYPTPDNPLAILAHAAANVPGNHLYHLAAEAALITRIWGQGCTVNIERLADAPPACVLLLLGHGSHDGGRARFCTAHGDLEQHELLLHGKRLNAVGASACLLAASEDVNHEPLGLRAIALLSAFAEDQLRPVAVTQTSPELTFA